MCARSGEVRRWAGCDIQRGARRIRGGDTERGDVEALLWGAALTSPRYISLEPALERIFCRLSPPPARTDLFAPLPPRRVPTIPVLGRPPSTFLYAEPYVAPEMLDREMEYERPYTNHRATVLPGAPFSFFFASPFRPFFSFYSIWPLPFFSTRLFLPSYSNLLSLSFIACLSLYASIYLYLFYIYTLNIRVLFLHYLRLQTQIITLEFIAYWCPSRKSNVSWFVLLLLLNICDPRFNQITESVNLWKRWIFLAHEYVKCSFPTKKWLEYISLTEILHRDKFVV